MTEKTYTVVVDDNGNRFKIYNQPESTVRELGLLQASPSRIKQKAPVDDLEFVTSKNIFGDIQVEKVAAMERKQTPKEEVVIATRDRMGNLTGGR
jgi:hypothetical protein